MVIHIIIKKEVVINNTTTITNYYFYYYYYYYYDDDNRTLIKEVKMKQYNFWGEMKISVSQKLTLFVWYHKNI